MISGGNDDKSGNADDPSKPEFWLRGLEEAATPFTGFETPELDTYAALYRSVLAYYGHRCAITGVEAGADELDAGLEVSAIRPRDAGGELHVSNFLCLCTAADRAFQAGHLTIGPDYEIIVDVSRVDRELLQAIHPDGKLALPQDSNAVPDGQSLAFHRSQIFLGGLSD